MRFFDEQSIFDCLARAEGPSSAKVRAVLGKGLRREGLTLEESAILANTRDPELLRELFAAAARVKDAIYGKRLVLFAPLYASDCCVNDCAYCSFHQANRAMERRRLTAEEIAAETKCLIDMGHKRVLIEFGEDPERSSIDAICEAIRTINAVRSKGLGIRRVNVNVAATTVDHYRRIKAEGIGTYQLFQETYHRATYERLHRGPKADYDRQITAHARAFEAGIDDLGIGALFGLFDWRFEVLSLVRHAQWMEEHLGVGPHTISVPRFQPAPTVAYAPEHPVSDEDFLKIIAILRLAVPYTGLILSTRESPELRRQAFGLGISQASAASITLPGGYARRKEGVADEAVGQFSTQDHRPLSEVVEALVADGLIPSFCTACYRSGRTGEAFMELAKPGDIGAYCHPNALLTFAEYLWDFGDAGTRQAGFKLIEYCVGEIADAALKEGTQRKLALIRAGHRDVFF